MGKMKPSSLDLRSLAFCFTANHQLFLPPARDAREALPPAWGTALSATIAGSASGRESWSARRAGRRREEQSTGCFGGGGS